MNALIVKAASATGAGQNQRGITLIDLLIVMAIVFITAGIGLPSFAHLLSDNRAQMYVKTLQRDIIYMRHYAINYGQPVTICPLDGGKCVNDWSKDISIFIDLNLNRKRNDDEKLLKLLPDPRLGDTLTYPRHGITFRTDGSINGFQSGTFRYCPDTLDSKLSKGLVVNQAGRPRFRDEDISCKK